MLLDNILLEFGQDARELLLKVCRGLLILIKTAAEEGEVVGNSFD